MLRKPAAICLALLLASPAPAEVTYDERLAMVRSLGQRYPGYVRGNYDEYQDLGLWGGIAVQTKWQAQTKRSELAIWNIVNESLTAMPFRLAQDYEAGIPCANKACKAWYAYFDVARNPPVMVPILYMFDPAWVIAQRRLWAAHTATIEWVFIARDGELDADFAVQPREERRFWRGWVRTVPLLDALNQPTFGQTIDKISKRSFPDCSPLARQSICDPLRLEPPSKADFALLMIGLGGSDPDEPAAAELKKKVAAVIANW